MRRIFLILIAISVSTPAVVKWMPNKSFNLPINYQDHRLPCSKQTVVFPEVLYETVKIDSSVSVQGLVLPITGELIFEDGTINFGTDTKENCTEKGNSYYLPKSKSSWAQPDVWSSPRFNEATPDAERVPCFDDEVVFPKESQFTVFLPQVTQYVKQLKWYDNYLTNHVFEFLVGYSSSLSSLPTWQQFILNDNGKIGVEIKDSVCNSAAGCPCQSNVLTIDCTSKFCHVPNCLNPIQPVGHCCNICGGFIVIDIDETFDMSRFKENVEETVDSYGRNIVYHIGRIPNNKVQLVVVDKGEYVGTSAEVINGIEYDINNHGMQNVAQISGGPVSKAGLGGKIALSMFFLVMFVMLAIYVYFYKIPNLPEIRIPSARTGRVVLSRFNRRTDSVVSLTSRRDSTATLRSGVGTAFRNPLYDSKRGRVEVAESVVEE